MDNDLGRAPLGPLLARLAIPAVTAQMVNALYNIVDRIYIGHLPTDSALALTSLGICFPILMLVSAFASLIGAGGSARASIAMGEGHHDRAERILGSCVFALVAIALVITVLLQIFREPLLYLFGGSDDTIGFASSYLKIYLSGSVFVLLATGLNPFLTAQGFATTAMKTVLIGALCNIALDPVFIYLLELGVAGAAIATVLSQLISCIWVLAFLLGKRTRLHLRRAQIRPDWSCLAPVLALGISPFVMQSSESILNIVFNNSLQRYGGDLAVGAMTIAASVTQIRTMLLQGICQGAQPILSFNYGAGNLDRVRGAFRLAFGATGLLGIVLWLVVLLWPEPFVAIFNDDPALTSYAVWALGIYSSTMFVLSAQFVCQQSFLALGQAKISLLLAILRKFILLIPLILILPHFFADKVFAVFLAEPICDCVAAAVTTISFFVCLPKILRTRAASLQA